MVYHHKWICSQSSQYHWFECCCICKYFCLGLKARNIGMNPFCLWHKTNLAHLRVTKPGQALTATFWRLVGILVLPANFYTNSGLSNIRTSCQIKMSHSIHMLSFQIVTKSLDTMSTTTSNSPFLQAIWKEILYAVRLLDTLDYLHRQNLIRIQTSSLRSDAITYVT